MQIRNLINHVKYAPMALMLMIVTTGCYSVNEGELAVRTNFGKTKEDPNKAVKEAGLHMTGVFGQKTHRINIRTQKYVHETESYTNDVQQAKLIVSVNFRHKNDKAIALDTYKRYGENWKDVILVQYINQILKDEVGRWEAAELVADRDVASKNIEKDLKKFFSDGDFPIEIETVTIDDVQYQPEFEKAVEEKVIARQNFLKEQNNTARIEEVNKQTVSKASAEAEALNILGKALRSNPNVTELKAIEKWNGVSPQVVSGANMIIPFGNQGR